MKARDALIRNMKEAISNALETMFFLPVQFPDTECTLQTWFPDKRSLIGATLKFHGPWSGSFFIFIPVKVVNEITANFLGLREEEITEEQEKDTVKEAINIIGGHMFSFFDKEGEFRLGIPELLKERDVTDDKLENINGDFILVETENNHLAVGIVQD
ncbi:MAG TPA: chemotaxis protein CheX [Desulfatiglandales bacterium]|nr:chemotaxis protein CheX [Desulfatiglandales bacterium]